MLVSEVGVALLGLHVDPLKWAEGLCWWFPLCPLVLPVPMNVWSPWEMGSQTSDSVPPHPHKEWALLLGVRVLHHDARHWALALPWLGTQVSTPGDGAGGLDPEHAPFPPDQDWERPRTSMVWKISTRQIVLLPLFANERWKGECLLRIKHKCIKHEWRNFSLIQDSSVRYVDPSGNRVSWDCSISKVIIFHIAPANAKV